MIHLSLKWEKTINNDTTNKIDKVVVWKWQRMNYYKGKI